MLFCPYFCTQNEKKDFTDMQKTKKMIQAAWILCCLLMAGCRPSAPAADRYVVVLSMDGFRSDYPGRAHTPVLDSLGKAGVKAAFRPCYPSVTFPNHYSMATGLHPDHHGLVHNSFYDPALDSVYTRRSTDPRFFGGEPIWNTAERQGVRTANYYWVGSEIAVNGRQPSTWKKFDSSVPFKNRADSVIAWLRRPAETRPHLVMWYLEEPDYSGHVCTPDSAATTRAIERVDSVLGYFFAQARKLDIFDKTDFLVVSDHGMATYTPEKSVDLCDYLPRDSFDHVFDGVPTLLYPKKGYADKAYEILKKVPNVTVWRKGEVPERFVYGNNPRVSELIVAPHIGTYVVFGNRPKAKAGGAHGYDNFTPEMEGIFYAAGPSFKEHKELPAMPNVNLYLIIARLLGIQPAPNDGDSTLVEKIFG